MNARTLSEAPPAITNISNVAKNIFADKPFAPNIKTVTAAVGAATTSHAKPELVPVPPDHKPKGNEFARKISIIRHKPETIEVVPNSTTQVKKTTLLPESEAGLNNKPGTIIKIPTTVIQPKSHHLLKDNKINIGFPIELNPKRNNSNLGPAKTMHETQEKAVTLPARGADEDSAELSVKKEENDAVLMGSQDSSVNMLQPKSPRISHLEKPRGRFKRRFIVKRSPFSEIIDEGISEYLGNRSYLSNQKSMSDAVDSYTKGKGSRDMEISLGNRTTVSLHKKDASKQVSKDYRSDQPPSKENAEVEKQILQLTESIDSYDSID